MVGGDAECWCASLPPLTALPVPAGTRAHPSFLSRLPWKPCAAEHPPANLGIRCETADKILLVSAIILAVLVAVLTVLSALSLRQFSLYTAERHARSVAETVKVGLTESMINGTIKKRQQFLARMSGIPGSMRFGSRAARR
jgi:hypothetical protein